MRYGSFPLLARSLFSLSPSFSLSYMLPDHYLNWQTVMLLCTTLLSTVSGILRLPQCFYELNLGNCSTSLLLEGALHSF